MAADIAKPRHDWYQTASDVVITISLKNTRTENVRVNFSTRALSVTVHRGSGLPDYSLELDLAHEIQPDGSTWRVLPSKIELKVRKKEALQWSCLEGEDPLPPPPPSVPAAQQGKRDASSHVATGQRPAYPTSCLRGPKNWDAIEKEAIREDDEQKLEGDAAVNKAFQQIYGSADDDVKRAMIKSFVESNGTVLSTSWDEVKQHKVHCEPPKSCEWKKFD